MTDYSRDFKYVQSKLQLQATAVGVDIPRIKAEIDILKLNKKTFIYIQDTKIKTVAQ